MANRWSRKELAALIVCLALIAAGLASWVVSSIRALDSRRAQGHWPTPEVLGPPSAIPPEELQRAIDDAFAALMARRLRVDEAVFSSQAAVLLRGRHVAWAESLKLQAYPDDFDGRLQSAFWTVRHDPPVPLPPAPVPSEVTPVFNANPQDPEDREVAVAVLGSLIECLEGKPNGRASLQRAVRMPGVGGYIPTHQLMFLVIGLTRGCVTEEDMRELRLPLARRIYAELLADESVTDLNLERMAVLCFANLCNWVDDEQVQRVLDTQQPSGLWLEQMEPDHIRDEHATAFALYLLARKRAFM